MVGNWEWKFLKILSNVNLAEYTSWMIGGDADHFCLPTSMDELRAAFQEAKNNNWPITVFSGGSNVLIADRGIRGLTICLRRLSAIESKIENNQLVIECLAGTAKSELLKLFLKNQLAPALFLAGLPGDVGGGVVMNAGVAENFSPREFMDFVTWIDVMDFDGQTRRISKEKLQISYRHCDGWQPGVIVRAQISWPLVQDKDVILKVREANKIRLTKQPLDMPSCGSVFRNPDNAKAAQLIDQCGLKGFCIGDAQVSLKHANFIVNLKKATATDVWNVISHVKRTVLQQKSVELQTEVVRLGQWT
ncbi:MAG: UDP-N-acetylenolpyruvoylglucosamine reductase [Bdellovibrionales bacterium RIFCSPHIGHO2_01_FULL_40_29]|nr:MAG: UDP-N-acetylenolpyruvoylglucosamine reductase [Bdellovibrionales bacterium RIFCSPHIGHO2_01_FULL_40_29]OFZ34009.1 MAG: UDP-N-acetylenolpyruvoylglucosamine reductase [Bdellovibrionales bacterium RIFCSPHIGHO2_02_FULL_40_15]